MDDMHINLFVCISSMSDMHTKYYLPLYAYQTWTIVHYTHIVCVQYVYQSRLDLVRISDTDDMHTHKFICISSMSNMCTKYYLPWYAYQTWMIVHYTHIICVQYAYQSR